jgi:hypothetical protein
MLVQFPNAANYLIPRGLFIAAWKVWFKRFSEDPALWRTGAMPLRASDGHLSELLADGHRFSLEVAGRLLVPWNYRNQRQTGDEFVTLNAHVVTRVSDLKDPETGEPIPAVRLTDQALDFWDRRTFIEQDQWMNYAEARIQADIETDSDAPVILDDAGIEIIGADTYPPYVPDKDAPDEEFVRALVAWIDEDVHQPMYQRKPVGDAVSSWHDRLTRFFWPKPRNGYAEFMLSASPLLYYGGVLADRVRSGLEWTETESQYAVKVARELFDLVGTPQRQVTVENVRKVFEAAIGGKPEPGTKMNSGWTFLAAYASATLERQVNGEPLMAWNSRIATSVISRLDFLLTEAGVSELGDRFPGLGLVPGWGGTRPRQYSLQWPSGYRQWACQYAAGRIGRQIRDILNHEVNARGQRKYRTMPLVGGDRGPWTIRGVELVLFQDGY